jgi:hypothetical protein
MPSPAQRRRGRGGEEMEGVVQDGKLGRRPSWKRGRGRRVRRERGEREK